MLLTIEEVPIEITHHSRFLVSALFVISLACGTEPAQIIQIQNELTNPLRDLQIVAHQDDDIIFINPDIEDSIRAGNYVRTVFVTAGNIAIDGTDTNYWRNREQGALAAYATMAGAITNQIQNTVDVEADYYDKSTVTLQGNAGFVDIWTLRTNSKVSLVFLRLPAANGGTQQWPLEHLWHGNLTTLTTVGQIAGQLRTYTLDEIIELMTGILAEYQPHRIRTQESSGIYYFDHTDHLHSARLSLEAYHRYLRSSPSPRPRLLTYRGYNVDQINQYPNVSEPANLSSMQYAQKGATLDNYCIFDNATSGPGCYMGGWGDRRYPLSDPGSSQGILQNPDGCLAVHSNGIDVQTVACTSASPHWQLSSDGTLSTGGQCLVIDSPSTSVHMNTCANATQWRLQNDGSLIGERSKLLVRHTDGTLGITDYFQYTVNLTQGGTPRTGGVSGLGQAADNLRWNFLFPSTSLWTQNGDFSDANLWDQEIYYSSIRLADVDGDQYADACSRASGGIICALNHQGGGFQSTATWRAPDFSDGLGWDHPEYAATIQFADLNHDQKADVCGRGILGIWCALSTGSGFSPSQIWSQGNNFSDAAHWNQEIYYRSIRLADVNGDGYADVCGRSSGGIVCALNNQAGAFNAATDWITSDFSDVEDWNHPQYASTIQFGDIDGDGRDDVCGRDSSGIICARSNGQTFESKRLWGFRDNFGDEAGWSTAAGYYRSMRLADINGDGLVDICGRSISGIACASSTGSTFGVRTLVLPHDFSNAAGWLPAQYGTTIEFGDLDRDGRMDVCGRGISGLSCSIAP